LKRGTVLLLVIAAALFAGSCGLAAQRYLITWPLQIKPG
jgi:hypothetical protein